MFMTTVTTQHSQETTGWPGLIGVCSGTGSFQEAKGCFPSSSSEAAHLQPLKLKALGHLNPIPESLSRGKSAKVHLICHGKPCL